MNQHGLYSKAAQIIRGLPQERGTAQQMVAAARKKGIKDAELQNAGPLPEGQVSREELAKFFEDRVPKFFASQYGENPSYMAKGQGRRFMDLQYKSQRGEELTPEERRDLNVMTQQSLSGPHVEYEKSGYDDEEVPSEPMYSEYKLPGGQDYRERLLHMKSKKVDMKPTFQVHTEHPDTPRLGEYGSREEAERANQEWRAQNPGMHSVVVGPLNRPAQNANYSSPHWDHPNVLAHIRLQDQVIGPTRSFADAKKWVQPMVNRIAEHMGASPSELGAGSADYAVKNGLITPQEAATLAQVKGWTGSPYYGQPGIGKRLLHVEELQSDWGQAGREHGFNTGEATKAYQDHIADLRNRFRQKLSWMGDDAAIDKRMSDTLVSEMAYALGEGDKHKELGKAAADERGKPPVGPYVTNTQHWTDLALKNVLREAALGNYDGIIFSPGQAQADRYGLEKHVGKLQLLRAPGSTSLGVLNAWTPDGKKAASEEVTDEDHLHRLVGRDVGQRLLSQPETAAPPWFSRGSTHRTLEGEDLKMGGQGMKGYYDNIVPKSVMRLAQQHDPEIQPGEPVQVGDYQAFHLPMTQKLKDSILDNGFPAFKRGGRVGFSSGGIAGAAMLRMRRAGINTRDDFWNRWRDHMMAKAGLDTRLSMTGSTAGRSERIDNVLSSHRQKADADGIVAVLNQYGPVNENGHTSARIPREIFQSMGIDPTPENIHAAYEALPDDETGRVGFAQGGAPDDQAYPAARAQAGELQDTGGVRGGAGVLQAPDEAPLQGLPQKIRVPLTGEVIQAGPDARIRGVARSYMQQAGMPYNPPTTYAKVDPARAKRIAKAFDAMPHTPDDPLTAASYDAMIRETLAQYQAAKAAGFKAEFWHPDKQRDPYEASPRLAVEDVRKNNHMWVFPTYAGYGTGQQITEDDVRDNPMLRLTGETWNGIPVTVNDIFRAVHDYFGHAKEGVGFRHDGEENAWRSHAAMYSPLARLAMTTETRGQNSWLNFGPHGEKNQSARTEDTVFAPQKVGILPHWAHHEGAEDFMSPQDIADMSRARAKHSKQVSSALKIARRFTRKP